MSNCTWTDAPGPLPDWATLYDPSTGEPRYVERATLDGQLAKRRPDGRPLFVRVLPLRFPTPGRGYPCPLHPDHPDRPLWDHLGLPVCQKRIGFRTQEAAELHASRKHVAAYAIIQRDRAAVG